MMFLSKKHEETYKTYLSLSGCHPEDRERKSLFYLLAGNKDLQTKGINRIYDFKENRLKFSPGELPEGMDLCSSSRAILKLACNLYNSGYESLSVSDTFYNLDKHNYFLVMQAIEIRFAPE